MPPRRINFVTLATLAAFVAPLTATQALASGPNEYSLSSSETNSTVSGYQESYQTQTYQTQTYQPQATETASPQFGEIVFDTQPYVPDTRVGMTETYNTQPYTGETIQPYQPAPLMPQPTYMPSATN